MKSIDQYDSKLFGVTKVFDNGDTIVYFPDYVEVNGQRLDKFITCPICGSSMRTITNTHLWKSHKMTLDKFKEMYPDSELQSPFSKYLHGFHFKNKSYEARYGKSEKERLCSLRSESATNQMKDPNQRDLRRDAMIGIPKSDRSIEKQLETKYGDIDISYREKALSYYGEECQMCGEHDLQKLVVHHKDHNNFGNDNVFSNDDIDNLEVLCRSCHGKTHSQGSNVFKGKSTIERGFATILSGLHEAFGLDLDDENLRDTPSRVARSYLEMLQGIDVERSENILRQAFPSNYDGMVTLTNIECYSMCPHHFLPVKYIANFGYIPTNLVLGLSKIPRFIKSMCQAPALQESTTANIVDKFMEIVKPQGCILTLQGFHMCMGCRGVEMPEVSTITTAIRGVFETPGVREEFFDQIASSKRGNHVQ